MTHGEITPAACMDSAIKGLYADLVPQAQHTLRQLAERALAADAAMDCVSEQNFNDCAKASYETRRAFLTELELATNIPAWMWRSLGESILP